MGGKMKVLQSLGIDPSVHDLNHQCSTTEVCTTTSTFTSTLHAGGTECMLRLIADQTVTHCVLLEFIF